MSQVLKNVISRKTRLMFSSLIWRRLGLEAHISKTKWDIEKFFGPVILDRYSYKKMQKKSVFWIFWTGESP